MGKIDTLKALFNNGPKELHQCALKVQANEEMGGVLYWKSVILWNLVRYGARPKDYVMFEFNRKSAREKNRYMTFYRYLHLEKHFKKTILNDILGNKIGEYKVFAPFIKREWMSINKHTSDDEILSFIAKHGVVIAKPSSGCLGRSVMKIQAGDDALIKELLGLRKKSDFIIEECLNNIDEIKRLNPTSLNTIRVFTLTEKTRKVHFLSVMLRVGALGSHVDNWACGGVCYNFDLETGICCSPGLDKSSNKYFFHPGCDVQMVGYNLPMFDELKQYILELCKLVPNAKFVGWDVALTPNGFDLVEMNCPGGHDIAQVFGKPVYHLLKKNW